jgi:hypothetical protein
MPIIPDLGPWVLINVSAFTGCALSPRSKERQASSQVLTSAFDDEKKYELTDLGTQFVRYTMEGVMPSIGPATATP